MTQEKQLKNGQTTTDPRLDRIVQFDEESREYPIRALVPTASKPRSYTWRCDAWLDQGYEGACVGFSFSHELAARPSVVKNTSYNSGIWVYNQARMVDEWPGENYDGTSVLAGAKVLTANGYFKEYRWAFGLDDLILAVGTQGPAVLGINWYSGMFEPDEKGRLHVDGYVAGGHAILCHGVNLKGRYFKLHNSWGKDWGINGECTISFEDMDRLLREQGEACIPIARTVKRAFVEA